MQVPSFQVYARSRLSNHLLSLAPLQLEPALNTGEKEPACTAYSQDHRKVLYIINFLHMQANRFTGALKSPILKSIF